MLLPSGSYEVALAETTGGECERISAKVGSEFGLLTRKLTGCDIGPANASGGKLERPSTVRDENMSRSPPEQ
jgi:hypothetical protein